jgi:hypothetical protein
MRFSVFTFGKVVCLAGVVRRCHTNWRCLLIHNCNNSVLAREIEVRGPSADGHPPFKTDLFATGLPSSHASTPAHSQSFGSEEDTRGLVQRFLPLRRRRTVRDDPRTDVEVRPVSLDDHGADGNGELALAIEPKPP